MATDPEFRRQGEYWRLAFNGQTVNLRDSVGLAYIARLLGEPHRDIPAVSLLAARAGIGPRVPSGSAGELLDDDGRKKYGNRYRDLMEDLEEATANNDLGLMEKLKAELESLGTELARATGLGGRPREKTDAERARKSVSTAVARGIKRVAAQHAALGRHLTACIRSGYVFSYSPEHPIDWRT